MAKPKDPPKPNSGRVRISCDDPDFDLLGWLGPDSPKYTGGFGGWTVTPRPRQVGMVTYDGVEPIELQFQLLWDGILRADRRRRPYEHPSSIRWVIRNVEFGDAIRRISDMHRTRLMLTFTLLEFVPPKFEGLKRRAFGKDLRKTGIWKVHTGDTPHSIAKHQHCTWTAIRELNHDLVRSANQKLKAGTKLRVPTRSSSKHRGK
jgi:nucleoid-associated protein YgaU